MTTSRIDASTVFATEVTLADDMLSVNLTDGRTIAAPVAWFPRLSHGTAAEVSNWRLK